MDDANMQYYYAHKVNALQLFAEQQNRKFTRRLYQRLRECPVAAESRVKRTASNSSATMLMQTLKEEIFPVKKTKVGLAFQTQ